MFYFSGQFCHISLPREKCRGQTEKLPQLLPQLYRRGNRRTGAGKNRDHGTRRGTYPAGL